MRRIRLGWVGAAAAAALVAALLAACGGGEDGDSFEGATAQSEDGVLTVQVPEGAAADGVEVEIVRLEGDDLPSELQDASVPVVGYELSPDGAEFSEPVVVTFRLDPGDLGIDLADGAVPVGVLLTVGSSGELEGLANGRLSRDGDAVVARGELTHFTPAIIVLSEAVVTLSPQAVTLAVGQSIEARVTAANRKTGEAVEIGGSIALEDEPFLGHEAAVLRHESLELRYVDLVQCADGWGDQGRLQRRDPRRRQL